MDKHFFRPASRTVGFRLRFKNSGHVITILWLCGLQKHRSCNAILFFPTDWLSHVSPFFVEVQRKEKCPLWYNLRSFTETTSKDAKCIEWKKKGLNLLLIRNSLVKPNGITWSVFCKLQSHKNVITWPESLNLRLKPTVLEAGRKKVLVHGRLRWIVIFFQFCRFILTETR